MNYVTTKSPTVKSPDAVAPFQMPDHIKTVDDLIAAMKDSVKPLSATSHRKGNSPDTDQTKGGQLKILLAAIEKIPQPFLSVDLVAPSGLEKQYVQSSVTALWKQGRLSRKRIDCHPVTFEYTVKNLDVKQREYKTKPRTEIRDAEIARHVKAGKLNKTQIAAKCKCTPATVRRAIERLNLDFTHVVKHGGKPPIQQPTHKTVMRRAQMHTFAADPAWTQQATADHFGVHVRRINDDIRAEGLKWVSA